MTREFLKNFGLEKATIDKILDENMQDIGKEKRRTDAAEAKLSTAHADLADARGRLAEARTELEALKKTNGNTAPVEILYKSNYEAEAVPSYEQEQVSRGLLAWLNQYPNFPAGIRRFDFEFLEEDRPCMALSTIQGTYITKRYIGGDYMAEYPFKLVYRGQPASTGDRLKMDEALDAIGDWAALRAVLWEEKPDLGSGKRANRIFVNARSSLFGRYDNGDEDHQILMTLNYYGRTGNYYRERS